MASPSGPDQNLAKLLKPVIKGLESGAVRVEALVIDHREPRMTIALTLSGLSLEAIGRTFEERERRRIRGSTNPKVRR